MVNTEYLFIIGLNSARYNANDSWAARHNKSPLVSPTLVLTAVALEVMRMRAPLHPRITPTVFFQVIGSLRMKNESIMAKIGMDVVMMLAFIGEVMLKPIV